MNKILPEFKEFKKLASKGNVAPVYKEIFADEDTPVSVFRKLAHNQKHAYLLESLAGGEHWARYSFLSFDPDKIFQSNNGEIKIFSKGKCTERFRTSNPVESLQEFLSRYKPVHLDGLPRFWGGVVGYINYDVVKYFENIGDILPDDLRLPEMKFLLSSNILAFDHLRHTLFIIAAVETGGSSNLEERYKRGAAQINSIEEKIRKSVKSISFGGVSKRKKGLKIKSNVTRKVFEKSVEKAKEYIFAGDCIQIVLSQRFSVPINAEPFDIYRALRIVNPSPYLYYMKCGDFHIVGSSPEILVRKEGDLIETRPIAGTRHRGRTDEEDKRLEKELLADPKELAEHLMLVDLGRNDMGRVAEVGSVEVPEFKAVERYSHVMHIVSQVKARLKKGLSAKDVLRAAFPAGTLSGAPKIRAMQIIEELEKSKRGPYGGALGYFSFEGNVDMAITIRTIIIKDGAAYIQAGAGIVADSVPAKEYTETRNKAQALINAIKMAEKGFI